MPSRLIARAFVGWFVLFVSLLGLGTVFFGPVLWFTVPVVAGNGCIGGGTCSAMAAVLGLWLQPSLLVAAALVGAIAFYRRGLAVGSRLWALFPLALLLPNLPSLFMLGNAWGVNLAAAFLFFPRWSLLELLPLMAFGVLLCFQVEYMPGFGQSIARTRLYNSVPVGLAYVLTCLWICSDVVLALSPHFGLPVAVAQDIRDALHYPLSIAGGEVFAGLPPYGQRPDLVVPLGTLVNLVVFTVLVFALVFDGSGRLRRAGALIFIDKFDGDNSKPLFRPGRKAGD
ncbi:hypothetical protein [Hoeflea sp.]|uniref:hypothetical protein n=1 Tax=Hoeflea sp. TaxID=1940281 RepID=UPI003A92AA6C